jgi:hypothetical protein
LYESYGNSLILNIKVSRSLALLMIALHAVSGVLLFLTDLPIWLSCALTAMLCMSVYRVLGLHAFRHRHTAIETLRLTPEGALLLKLVGSDAWVTAHVRSRFIHPALMLLQLGVEEGRWPRSLVVAADAVEPDAFRRFRAALLAPPKSKAD